MDGFFVEMEGGSLAEISRRNKAEFFDFDEQKLMIHFAFFNP